MNTKEREYKGNQGVRKGEGMRKYPCMQERVRCEKQSAHKIDYESKYDCKTEQAHIRGNTHIKENTRENAGGHRKEWVQERTGLKAREQESTQRKSQRVGQGCKKSTIMRKGKCLRKEVCKEAQACTSKAA